MTREEAIKWLKILQTSTLIYGEHAEAIDMAISALSAIDEAESSAKICDICQFRGLKGNAECCYSAQQTEPSDLISRADAIKALSEYYEYSIRMVDEITDLLNSIPSVSAERVGEWIKGVIDFTDGSHCYGYKCSICGFETLNEPNYCEVCGAKMKGGAE